MKNYLSVQWHTGMLMLAQHFQQQEKYYLYKSNILQQAISSDLFGIISLKYQIINNILQIHHVHAIFPGSIPVFFESSEENILELNLTPELDNTKYSIFLTIPENNIDPLFTHTPTPVGPIADEYDNSNKEIIVKLQPNLSLILLQTPPLKHISIKLFECSVINQVIVLHEYQYPLLKWDPALPLWELLQTLKQNLRSKLSSAQMLSSAQAAFDQKTQFFNLINMQLFTSLLQFENALHLAVHPRELFAILLSLASNFIIFNKNIPSFIYLHTELYDSYINCINYINLGLNLLQEQYQKTTFLYANNIFQLPLLHLPLLHLPQLNLPSSISDSSLLIAISLQSTYLNQNYSNILEEWIKTCIISTNSMLDLSINNRILGCHREIISAMDLNIRAEPNVRFFKILFDPLFIKNTDEFLCIYNDQNNEIVTLQSYQ